MLSYILLITHLLVTTTNAHYKAICVGTDDPSQTAFCSDDNMYVYICTNHGYFDSCYRNTNQGRVDVNTATPYSRIPHVSNNMGYASTISIPDCVGSLATGSNTICKANAIKPSHCSCSHSNWFRYGPIGQQSTPGSFLASVHGYGCQTENVIATKSFSTGVCSNTYPAYDVTVPCSGSFPCARGTSGTPSVFEGESTGTVIAHFDYSDCDTCTSTHVNRPACTLSDGTTTLGTHNVFPTVSWAPGATPSEADPIYELADDAGGRFAIETGTNKLKTGTVPLDFELPVGSYSGSGSWSCTSSGTLKCFSGPGITNQVSSASSNPGSTWDATTKEWTIYVYVTDVYGCRNTGGATFKSGVSKVN